MLPTPLRSRSTSLFFISSSARSLVISLFASFKFEYPFSILLVRSLTPSCVFCISSHCSSSFQSHIHLRWTCVVCQLYVLCVSYINCDLASVPTGPTVHVSNVLENRRELHSLIPTRRPLHSQRYEQIVCQNSIRRAYLSNFHDPE